jgi:hypothetical protein
MLKQYQNFLYNQLVSKGQLRPKKQRHQKKCLLPILREVQELGRAVGYSDFELFFKTDVRQIVLYQKKKSKKIFKKAVFKIFNSFFHNWGSVSKNVQKWPL